MRSLVVFVFCLVIPLIAVGGRLQAAAKSLNNPIWAKQATVLDLSCSSHEQSIPSPDRRSALHVLCNKREGNDPTYSIRLITSDNHRYESQLEDGAHELLWSPNSMEFFVDGGTSAYAGFFVTVYRFEPLTGIKEETITQDAQRDMVKSFPPCHAFNRDEKTCKSIAKDPEYNMSGLAWRPDSAAIYVFAEVPCSSSYGGIMCQTLGYELSVHDGRIVTRLSALQAKEQWGQYAAWDIRIPDPPKYGPAHVTR